MSCPSCVHDNDTAVEMESNAFGVFSRKNITHTCPQCGYADHRP